MQARMSNPVAVLPDAMKAINILVKTTTSGGVPRETLDLVHLRASQVNGCSGCVDGGWRNAKISSSVADLCGRPSSSTIVTVTIAVGSTPCRKSSGKREAG